MKIFVPCDLRAANSSRVEQYGSISGLVLEDTYTETRYLVTTGLLAFKGVDSYFALFGEKQDVSIRLNAAPSASLLDLSARNALALELPPDLEIYSGLKSYVRDREISIGTECRMHPNIEGCVFGIGAVIRAPLAETGAKTITMTGLLKIRTDLAAMMSLAGAIWHIGDSALAMTVAQNDEFAFAMPVCRLLAGLEHRFRVYESSFEADAGTPGFDSDSGDSGDWQEFERIMTKKAA